MRAAFAVLLVLFVATAGCHRRLPENTGKPLPVPNGPAPVHDVPASGDFAVNAIHTQEGLAYWYDVPEQSLPQRKAWPQEMTAASDTLPQDVYVRIRRLDGKGDPVIVRITDRGVHRKGALVDVSHATAEALGIVKTGETRVRVETLALRNASTDKPIEKKNEPTAPKLTSTPAVSQQAEKAAANAKTGGQSAP